MAYNQTTPDNSNNGLYFIVGGLLVLALIIGAFVLNTNRSENAYEPAAGVETSAPSTTNSSNSATPSNTGATDTTSDSNAPLAP